MQEIIAALLAARELLEVLEKNPELIQGQFATETADQLTEAIATARRME